MESSNDSHHLAFVDFKIQPPERQNYSSLHKSIADGSVHSSSNGPFLIGRNTSTKAFRCQRNFYRKAIFLSKQQLDSSVDIVETDSVFLSLFHMFRVD